VREEAVSTDVEIEGVHYRLQPITLWVTMSVRVPVDWTEDSARFYVEENHCIENLVHQLVTEMADADKAFHESEPNMPESTSVCILCTRGGAVLGTHDIEELVARVAGRRA